MGIGMVLICSPQDVEQLTRAQPEARVIGKVVKQRGKERMIIE